MTKGRNRRQPSVISLGEVRTSRTCQSLLNQLETFCDPLPEDEPWSAEQFFGGPPSEQELEVLGLSYLDWLAFDYQAWEDGRTVLERLAETAKLDDAARAMLHAWRKTRLGLYEIQAGFGGASLLRDCFTGAEYSVQEDPGVDPLQPGELVICRVLSVGESFQLGFDVRTTTAAPLSLVREAVERELLRLRRQMPDATWDHLFKLRWPTVHDAITAALASSSAAPLPRWQTPPSSGRMPDYASPLQHEVAKLIWLFETEDDVSHTDRLRGLQLWWDAAGSLQTVSGRAEAWAAGAVYAHLHYALGDPITQADVAEAFGLSVSTVAARARAIVEALGLEELDDRYTDPFDPRVRFRLPPEPLAVKAVAVSELAAPPADDGAAAAERLLALQPDDVSTLALLGQSALATGKKKEARSYADRAREAYVRQREEGRSEGLLRVVELLAELGDHEGILAVTAAESPAELPGPVLRRMAVAASRAERRADAGAWLQLAREKGEPLNLVEPFINALGLMAAKRIPVFKLDFQERLDPLMGWLPKLNALTRSHLVCAIFLDKAKDAVQAVRALGAQRDPWAGRLLKHLYRQTDLPRTVQEAVERALRRWE